MKQEKRRKERKNAKRVIRELNKYIAVKERERTGAGNPETGAGDCEGFPDGDPESSDEEDLPHKKRNPYSSVTLEYEKRWQELQMQDNTDTDKINDNVPWESDIAANVLDSESNSKQSDLPDIDIFQRQSQKEITKADSIKAMDTDNVNDEEAEKLADIKHKLKQLPGVGFGFSANVAAIANMRSQQLGMETDTFGDSGDDTSNEDE